MSCFNQEVSLHAVVQARQTEQSFVMFGRLNSRGSWHIVPRQQKVSSQTPKSAIINSPICGPSLANLRQEKMLPTSGLKSYLWWTFSFCLIKVSRTRWVHQRLFTENRAVRLIQNTKVSDAIYRSYMLKVHWGEQHWLFSLSLSLRKTPFTLIWY